MGTSVRQVGSVDGTPAGSHACLWGGTEGGTWHVRCLLAGLHAISWLYCLLWNAFLFPNFSSERFHSLKCLRKSGFLSCWASYVTRSASSLGAGFNESAHKLIAFLPACSLKIIQTENQHLWPPDGESLPCLTYLWPHWLTKTYLLLPSW